MGKSRGGFLIVLHGSVEVGDGVDLRLCLRQGLGNGTYCGVHTCMNAGGVRTLVFCYRSIRA